MYQSERYITRYHRYHYTCSTEVKFSIQNFFNKCDQIRSDFGATFTEVIINKKLHFSCSVCLTFFFRKYEPGRSYFESSSTTRSTYRSSHQRCSIKKLFLKFSQNSQGNTCARVSFLIKLQVEPCNFVKKETLTQAFSCEFCEIYNNTFFTKTSGRLLLNLLTASTRFISLAFSQGYRQRPVA